MFWNQSFERQRKTFVAQFAPEGAGFVYRRFQVGAAYRATAAERDAFVADFDRRQRRRKWVFIALLIAMMVGFVALVLLFARNATSDALTVGFIAAVIAAGAVFAVSSMRDYTAPARALAERTPISDALSTEERRTVALSNLTWGKLATAAALMGMLILRGYPFGGWNKLWFVLAGAGFLMVAVQAFRKWQFDSES